MYYINGIEVEKNKISKHQKIVDAGLPNVVRIPLDRHCGVSAVPVVKKNAKVKVGMLIAKEGGEVSANVFSSVAGKVVEVRDDAIVIEATKDEFVSEIIHTEDVLTNIPDDRDFILQKIRDCGIVGMGGAGFPTYVKLKIAMEKQVKHLVINGMEGEPYFTGDNRLMIEMAEEIVIGARIINKLLGIQNAIIVVDVENKEAIAALSDVTKRYVGVNVKPIKAKYPVAAERQLIRTIYGTKISKSNLPQDYGYVVQNVGTVLAIYDAVMKNKPLYERVVTISGDAAPRPKNFMVRSGTSVSFLLERAEVDIKKAKMLILDGLMMGRTIQDLDMPVSVLDGGLLVFAQAKPYVEASSCIRCNSCSSNCPVSMQPFAISNMLKIDDLKNLYKLRPDDCISCGICSYVCPAKIPLLDFVKAAKERVKVGQDVK